MLVAPPDRFACATFEKGSDPHAVSRISWTHIAVGLGQASRRVPRRLHLQSRRFFELLSTREIPPIHCPRMHHAVVWRSGSRDTAISARFLPRCISSKGEKQNLGVVYLFKVDVPVERRKDQRLYYIYGDVKHFHSVTVVSRGQRSRLTPSSRRRPLQPFLCHGCLPAAPSPDDGRK